MELTGLAVTGADRSVTAMSGRGHLRSALAHPGFRRLFTVRLAGQFADGVFQASLAGAVLFNPDHQARAADVAAGFTVILLPYSLVGPFAGVLLDRWWRQRVLVNANLLRAIGVVGVGVEIASGLHGQPFYFSALVVVSINRFVLSGLSTALPHVVAGEDLVTANALSGTAGSLATTVGAGAAILLRIPLGSGDPSYAAMAFAAAVPYLLAARVARPFPISSLGPDETERAVRETARDVVAGFVAGYRHVRTRGGAYRALLAVGVFRLCYGVATVCTLLLYRNHFHDDGPFRAGLTGLAQAITLLAVGSALAALLTPAATRRFGFVRWQLAMYLLAAVVELGFVLPYRLPLLLLAAIGLGLSSQGIKISVDTLVQQSISDDFRGRVFSLYDTLFNLAFVAAAVLTALAVPNSGYSPASVVALAAVYAATGLAYFRAENHA